MNTEDEARALIARGWAPIPLPPRQKYPPPTGLTGYGGRYLDALDPAYDWTGNLAVRLWPEVVGIDLDAYAGGVVGLGELARRFGQLPRTWSTSSSRGDRSGIYLYAIPAGATFVTDPEPGVDIVQAHHRYALVAPSIHPEGRPYRWSEPDGSPAEMPPEPNDLTPLPTRWIDGLATLVPKLTATAAARPEVVQAFVDAHVADNNPPALRGVLAKLAPVTAGGRHDGLVTAMCWAMREAAAGWYPADVAIGELWDWWQHVLSDDPRRRNGGEFDAIVRWAVAQVQSDPERVDELRARLEQPESIAATATSVEEPVQDPDRLTDIDWSDTGEDDPELIHGFAFGGRWTQIIASAKQGKSTLVAVATLHAAHGLDPWSGTTEAPVDVLWLNGEMGRQDLRDIIEATGYRPTDLTTWRAIDAQPRLDTPAGAELLLAAVAERGSRLVVLDGLNSFLSPSRMEKDDDGWRALFRYTITPLKARGVGVVSTDNLGKDVSKGARGSSVKSDKADAVMMLTKLADGVRLHTTHRRTDQFVLDLVLNLDGLGGDVPMVYRRADGGGVPAGTAECIQALDRLGVELECSVRAARRALGDARDRARSLHQPVGIWQFRTEVIAAALRARRGVPHPSGNALDELLGNANGERPA